MPISHQPKQNQADSGTAKINVNPANPGPRRDGSRSSYESNINEDKGCGITQSSSPKLWALQYTGFGNSKVA